MPDDFPRALPFAYGSYDMPDIVRFRNSSFQWCKKFTFTSPDEERRYTFKLGDYINVKQEAQPTQGLQDIVRIDQIFIHKWDKAIYSTAKIGGGELWNQKVKNSVG